MPIRFSVTAAIISSGVNGRVAAPEYSGMEVIGYNASSHTYSSHFFDNQGNSPTYQVSFQNDIWTYIEETQRATVMFSDKGNTVIINIGCGMAR